MQLYDITIPVNTTRQLDAPGSYFYYYAGSAGGADSTITLRGLSSGLRLILKPGQAFRLPTGSTETSWVLTNSANTATIIGTVLVGDGDVTDNRVTGSVEVIDGGKNRTLAGNVFMASAGAGGVAGQFQHVQLWNPAASGRNLFVSQIQMLSNGQSLRLTQSNAQLANSSAAPVNKNMGSAVASLALSRSESNAAPIGSIDYLNFGTVANQFVQYKLTEPIVVTPGKGLIIGTGTLAASLNTSFEYYEESV